MSIGSVGSYGGMNPYLAHVARPETAELHRGGRDVGNDGDADDGNKPTAPVGVAGNSGNGLLGQLINTTA